MHCSITAEFSLNTPLFSSGADKTIPELRVSEIKAALRFWWRAMNYGLVDTSTGNCRKLVARESELFGSTKGQSPFLLRMVVTNIDAIPPKSATALVANDKTRYLGYGLTETDANRFGKAADSGPTFTIELTLKPAALDKKQEYVNALKLFGMFGGLGYRSRRGFGSVTLGKLWFNGTEQELPQPVAAYPKLFQEGGLLNACPSATTASEYSAFVKNPDFCRVMLINQAKEAYQTGIAALDAVAERFKKLLTSSDRGTPRTQKGRTVGTDDVSWAYMGLPRKYAYGSPEHKPVVLPGSNNLVELERRASPLLFHVYKAGDNDYRVVAILFKSRFLPENYGVAANRGAAVALPVPPADGYAWIDSWLQTIGTKINNAAGTP